MARIQLMKPGRKPPIDAQKLARIGGALPLPPAEALETLLIFDARGLDRETRQDLLRLLPQLVHIRKAWKAEFLECGCVCCHQKKTGYCAGGFCDSCWRRIYARMHNRFRKAMAGRDIEAETAAFADALQLKYNAAQRLLNGGEE